MKIMKIMKIRENNIGIYSWRIILELEDINASLRSTWPSCVKSCMKFLFIINFLMVIC